MFPALTILTHTALSPVNLALAAIGVGARGLIRLKQNINDSRIFPIVWRGEELKLMITIVVD